MRTYKPQAPNELADAQLNRTQYESEASKSLLASNKGSQTINSAPPRSNNVTTKESYKYDPWCLTLKKAL